MSDQLTKLACRELSMRYGRRVLFRDLSLEAAPGMSLAITGRNGSGKSTLLKILAGLLTPTQGEVDLVVRGTSVSDVDRPLSVGFVAPYLQLYEPFSAFENLKFLAQARRIEDSETRIVDVLGQVGLDDRQDDFLSTYSTGMRQRLRIAAALLHDPAVLLLDEPSATLDDAGRALAESLIGMDEKVVVVATNDPEEAALCGSSINID